MLRFIVVQYVLDTSGDDHSNGVVISNVNNLQKKLHELLVDSQNEAIFYYHLSFIKSNWLPEQ